MSSGQPQSQGLYEPPAAVLVTPDVVTPELLEAIRQNRHGIADLLSQYSNRNPSASPEDWRDSLIMGIFETFQDHLSHKGAIRRSTVNAAIRFYESQYRVRRTSVGGSSLKVSLKLTSLNRIPPPLPPPDGETLNPGLRYYVSRIIQRFGNWRRK